MRTGIYSYPGTSRITYGIDFCKAAADEVELVGARRVLLLASGTLRRETDLVQRLRSALGTRLVAECAAIAAHTSRDDVLTAVRLAREARADLVLTLGGGSITDAAKMVTICLANDIHEPAQLDSLRTLTRSDGSTHRPSFAAPAVRSVCIPTTLSAGEFSAGAGCTDTASRKKEMYFHPQAIPRTVILDPAVTVQTPPWLWLSTGIRAVDHAVEDLCSVNGTPFSDGTSLHALRLLGAGLRRVKAEPADLAARLDCQVGAWMSIIGSSAGVNKGASHAIGHVLGGTAGVPHGYTSCVMLPHVLRFNEPVNSQRQAWVSAALDCPGQPAAQAVEQLIAGLGLPQRLRDVGVREEMLDEIAEKSMLDRWIHTNPRPIEGAGTVRKLLRAAW